MRYRVVVLDKQLQTKTEEIISVRKNTSLSTVAMKGLEIHLEKNPDSENEETLKIAKSLKRENNNEVEAFLEDLKNDIDIEINIYDINNYTYLHKEKGRTTTSYEIGYYSYVEAWRSQVDNEDGEKSLQKYLPSSEIICEHGNELMMDGIDKDNSNWSRGELNKK